MIAFPNLSFPLVPVIPSEFGELGPLLDETFAWLKRERPGREGELRRAAHQLIDDRVLDLRGNNEPTQLLRTYCGRPQYVDGIIATLATESDLPAEEVAKRLHTLYDAIDHPPSSSGNSYLSDRPGYFTISMGSSRSEYSFIDWAIGRDPEPTPELDWWSVTFDPPAPPAERTELGLPLFDKTLAWLQHHHPERAYIFGRQVTELQVKSDVLDLSRHPEIRKLFNDYAQWPECIETIVTALSRRHSRRGNRGGPLLQAVAVGLRDRLERWLNATKSPMFSVKLGVNLAEMSNF